MTYLQLREFIYNMNDEQLNQDVTVYFFDEYLPVLSLEIADEENEVLDENHPFLQV